MRWHSGLRSSRIATESNRQRAAGARELDAATSLGLLELNPDYCRVDGIHVYTVGIACEKIRSAYARLSLVQDPSLFR
jgi:hypothetical protein